MATGAYLIGFLDKTTFQPVGCSVWSDPPWMKAQRGPKRVWEVVIIGAPARPGVPWTEIFGDSTEALAAMLGTGRYDDPWMKLYARDVPLTGGDDPFWRLYRKAREDFDATMVQTKAAMAKEGRGGSRRDRR